MQEKNISANNFEQCQKCAICTTVCPVMAVMPGYPGPKQAGPDGERYRLKNRFYYEDTLKYCMNCKRCEVACPSDVRIGDIIQSAKLKYGKMNKLARSAMLSGTDVVGPLASSFAPLVNTALGLQPVKTVLDATIGVSRHRSLPQYASETFEKWFKKNAEAAQEGFDKHISYYHGCYANYNYPQLGKDFVAVMNALGYGVHLVEGEKCCGVAKISNGLIRSATKDAKHNVEVLRAAVEKASPVVTVSSSCTLTLREEYPHLLGVENSDLLDKIVIFEKFLWQAVDSGREKLVFKKDYKAKIAYHCPCHMERLGWGMFTVEILKMIPGVDLTVLESNCCGMAGTYGFKKENYATSQAIGKPLFDQIEAVNPDFVACECETCKWQIEMSSGYKVLNPVSILAQALDLEEMMRLRKAGESTRSL